jgi:hypothetical protein
VATPADHRTAVLADAPIAFWPLDEAGGSVALSVAGPGFAADTAGIEHRVPGVLAADNAGASEPAARSPP